MFGCSHCVPPVAPRISDLGLEPVARLVDESHLGISILACVSCGQQFLSVFTERIDWVKGEDPQCSTLLPMTKEEAARMIAKLEPAEVAALGLQRVFLRNDWPSGGGQTLGYTRGTLIGPHD